MNNVNATKEQFLVHECTRCHRTRKTKFLRKRKNMKGKTVWRCKAKSVCSTKGRRYIEKNTNKNNGYPKN